jgi:hypothetical protein
MVCLTQLQSKTFYSSASAYCSHNYQVHPLNSPS